MSLPLVSVIMPVFNAEEFIGEAIESVLRQTCTDLELIVVDDGSTDGSAAIARRFRHARTSVITQTNQGTAAARNAGMDRARGAFIAHMDADDAWKPDKTALQLRAFARHPECDIVSGHVSEFYSPGIDEAEQSRIRAARPCLPGHVLPALLVRRNAHERIGPFETGWSAGQDLAWMMRAKDLGMKMNMLPEIVLLRRLHKMNKGRRIADGMSNRLRIIKKALDRRRTVTR